MTSSPDTVAAVVFGCIMAVAALGVFIWWFFLEDEVREEQEKALEKSNSFIRLSFEDLWKQLARKGKKREQVDSLDCCVCNNTIYDKYNYYRIYDAKQKAWFKLPLQNLSRFNRVICDNCIDKANEKRSLKLFALSNGIQKRVVLEKREEAPAKQTVPPNQMPQTPLHVQQHAQMLNAMGMNKVPLKKKSVNPFIHP